MEIFPVFHLGREEDPGQYRQTSPRLDALSPCLSPVQLEQGGDDVISSDGALRETQAGEGLWPHHQTSIPYSSLCQLLIPRTTRAAKGSGRSLRSRLLWLHFTESFGLEKTFSTIRSKLCLIPTLSQAQSTECHLQGFPGHLQVWGLHTSLAAPSNA